MNLEVEKTCSITSEEITKSNLLDHSAEFSAVVFKVSIFLFREISAISKDGSIPKTSDPVKNRSISSKNIPYPEPTSQIFAG